MNVIIFTAWMFYMLISAVWLGDNGWAPIVGIPWIVIGFGYFIYVAKTDYERRR
jgi:hypothetical protein